MSLRYPNIEALEKIKIEDTEIIKNQYYRFTNRLGVKIPKYYKSFIAKIIYITVIRNNYRAGIKLCIKTKEGERNLDAVHWIITPVLKKVS